MERCPHVTAAIAAVLASLTACDPAPEMQVPFASEPVETAQLPILNGTDVADAYKTGVVQVNGCSGTIYANRWVLTAAHCFPWWEDADGDGVISAAEGASSYTVGPGPDGNNNPVTLGVSAVLKHPSATWGSTDGVDVALVWVDAGSFGFAVNHLPPLNYTNGVLNVHQGSYNTDLHQKNVWSFGYGLASPTRGGGTLRQAWKRVSTRNNANWNQYVGSPISGAGTNCSGDSGGPDYLWLNNKYRVAGVHSWGSHVDCATSVGVTDGNVLASAWRSWTASTITTCPTPTIWGACSF